MIVVVVLLLVVQVAMLALLTAMVVQVLRLVSRGAVAVSALAETAAGVRARFGFSTK